MNYLSFRIPCGGRYWLSKLDGCRQTSDLLKVLGAYEDEGDYFALGIQAWDHSEIVHVVRSAKTAAGYYVFGSYFHGVPSFVCNLIGEEIFQRIFDFIIWKMILLDEFRLDFSDDVRVNDVLYLVRVEL